jgi:hypothetical protein
VVGDLGSSDEAMGILLQFPGRPSYLIAQLDASIACMHALEAASRLPADDVRVEALGARLDMASLREAMDGLLPDFGATPHLANGLYHSWRSLESLLDQVTVCATYLYEESAQVEKSWAMREQLRMRCQSTLVELRRLRSLLVALTERKFSGLRPYLDACAGPRHGSAAAAGR